MEEAAWMLEFCVCEGLLFEKGGYYYNRFQLIPSLILGSPHRPPITRQMATRNMAGSGHPIPPGPGPAQRLRALPPMVMPAGDPLSGHCPHMRK